MLTKPERVLLQDGSFGHVLRQVAGGVTPLYLVVTIDSAERIVAEGDFIRTVWDGVERRQVERRLRERRSLPVSLEPSERERRRADRRQAQRRHFRVRL
jgi:hypothetical protein